MSIILRQTDSRVVISPLPKAPRSISVVSLFERCDEAATDAGANAPVNRARMGSCSRSSQDSSPAAATMAAAAGEYGFVKLAMHGNCGGLSWIP